MKRKGRKKHTVVRSIYPLETEYSYFRLCHHCLYLNESEQEISQCSRCNRYLTSDLSPKREEPRTWENPAEAFENDEEDSTFDRDEDDEESALRGQGYRSRGQLTGLSVLW